jgi:predicted Rossmann fold nucleotide-binding protein DprA/Smf involved in DNA uptake
MKLAIIGSRDFPDLQMVRDYVQSLHPSVDILSGGARGVDSVAVEEAKKRQMRWKEFFPRDRTHAASYHERNSVIVAAADAVVAFWDGESGGTRSTIEKARAEAKLLHVFIASPSDYPKAIGPVERC